VRVLAVQLFFQWNAIVLNFKHQISWPSHPSFAVILLIHMHQQPTSTSTVGICKFGVFLSLDVSTHQLIFDYEKAGLLLILYCAILDALLHDSIIGGTGQVQRISARKHIHYKM
jgi:hypothetical protein